MVAMPTVRIRIRSSYEVADMCSCQHCLEQIHVSVVDIYDGCNVKIPPEVENNPLYFVNREYDAVENINPEPTEPNEYIIQAPLDVPMAFMENEIEKL